MADVNQLRAFTGAAASDSEYLSACLEAATERVNRHIGNCQVPGPVLNQAILEVAGNLWQRRVGKQDLAAFGDGTLIASPTRPALDPLTPARALLAPWLGVGIA